jgi:putative ABC transport system substrate-binding protein
VRRREFITLLGSAAILARPAYAQTERIRRIAVLENIGEDDPSSRQFMGELTKGLQELGWRDGQNAEIDIRWAAGNPSKFRAYAAELVALAPDVALAATSLSVSALRTVSPNVPIVFLGVIDPVGSGLVSSLAAPGGRSTGFTLFEYSIAAKWLELLKEISPHIKRVAVLRDASIASGIGQFAAIQTVAPVDLELNVIDLKDIREVEHALSEFSQRPNGGVILTASGFAANHADQVAAAAAKYRLPLIYPFRSFIAAGGLISYGPGLADPYRRAATYIDRILRGESPQNLPVQAPLRYELVINQKTAKALNLTVPPALLARADEVIE